MLVADWPTLCLRIRTAVAADMPWKHLAEGLDQVSVRFPKFGGELTAFELAIMFCQPPAIIGTHNLRHDLAVFRGVSDMERLVWNGVRIVRTERHL